MDELYPSLQTLCEELKSTPRLVLAPSDAVPAERAVGAFFRAATSEEDIDLDGLDAEQVWAVVGGGVVDLRRKYSAAVRALIEDPPQLPDPGRPKTVFEEEEGAEDAEEADEDAEEAADGEAEDA